MPPKKKPAPPLELSELYSGLTYKLFLFSRGVFELENVDAARFEAFGAIPVQRITDSVRNSLPEHLEGDDKLFFFHRLFQEKVALLPLNPLFKALTLFLTCIRSTM